MNQVLDGYSQRVRSLSPSAAPAIEIMARNYFAWMLNEQNRTEEAKIQLEIAKKIVDRVGEYFQHAALEAVLMVPREIELGKEFPLRLDIVNISRKSCTLIRVEGLIPSGFKVNVIPDYCSIQDSLVAMSKRLEPFQVEPVKLNLQTTKSGVYCFEPRIVYVDDLGQNKTFKTKAVSVIVHPVAPATFLESVVETAQSKPFKSEAAQKAFEFLVSAFVEDYRRQRMPQERSGWRTLMEIAKQGKVSKYSLYGFSGNRGRAVSELERLGLVEAKIFLGERGRGGKILKLRVACESEIVRRQINLRNK